MSRMDEGTPETETDAETPYTPPAASWRLPVFVDAPLEEIKARVVECRNCPVFLLCEAGEGGTGWGCPTCGSTGVYVDEPVGSALPKDHIIMDCKKHKFHLRKEAEQITKCALCSGGQMELEVRAEWKTTAHYIATAYASIPVEQRQAELKKHHEYYKEYYAKVAAEKKAADAK